MARARRLDKTQQFFAVLRKNFILQTRGRKSLLGIGGWAGLLIQLLLPVAFFFVMYLPKYYIKPIRHGETLGPAAVQLESRSWAEPYDGPATTSPSHGGRARLLLSPASPAVRSLARVLARGLACPRAPGLRLCPLPALPPNFHCLFMPPAAVPPHGGLAGGRQGQQEQGLYVHLNAGDSSGGGGGERGGGDSVELEGGGDGGGGSGSGAGALSLQRWLRWTRWQQAEGVVEGASDSAAAAASSAVAAGGSGAAAAGAAGLLQGAVDPCADFATCVTTPACYEHVMAQMQFADSWEAARQYAAARPEQLDALLHFPLAAAGGDGEEEGQQEGQQVKAEAEGRAAGLAAAAPELPLPSSTPPLPPLLLPQLSRVYVGANHSDVPPSRLLLDLFEVVPTRGNGLALYRRYWFFSNLQLAVQRAVLGMRAAAAAAGAATHIPHASWPAASSPSHSSAPAGDLYGETEERRYNNLSAAAEAAATTTITARGLQGRITQEATAAATAAAAEIQEKEDLLYDSLSETALPANIAVSYKPFPWPSVTEDLGAASAAVFFNLLLVYAFLPPTRAVVGDIVREKELRLREGMRVLGLSEPSYWLSWGLTHWLLLALSGALCTLAGTYPFEASDPRVMLAFFWLYGAALVSYSYCLSTLFSSSRVAGTATQLLYALSMLPGFVLPSIYQYGSWTWYAACLAPPSAASLFAAVLVNWEKVAEGITPRTLWVPITQTNGFCAASVLGLLAADVVLYGLLAWYLDKVLPKSYGQRLPWWFVFDRRYWSSSSSKGSSSRKSISSSSSAAVSSSSSSGRRTKVAAALAGLTPGVLGGRVRGLWRGGLGAEDGARSEGVQEPLLPTSQLEGAGLEEEEGQGAAAAAAPAPTAVSVQGLVKTFRTTAGGTQVAVDHLSMQIEAGRITALLGHNGAGKTTTIHVLTGMLQPTAGRATVNGFDVATQMDQVRGSLGICPQFDILWPDLTVREHLCLYGAIKGFRGGELQQVAAAAACSVGLAPKLGSPAGELSGGQRRKLSVAIAFMGDPAVVFLDEPTSGMDPYSRRFTWDVIRRHRASSAIVLTTHSMEEADLLGDRVIIMARGRVAAAGSSMELKAAHGVGYNLTLVMDTASTPSPLPPQPLLPPPSQPASPATTGISSPKTTQDQVPTAASNAASPTSTSAPCPDSPPAASAAATAPPTSSSAIAASTVAASAAASASAVLATVRQYIPAAALVSAAGAEVVVRLPREASGAFPSLLRALDGPVGRQLGVASYGLSLTTLEEVFLAITAAADQQAAAAEAAAAAAANGSVTTAAAAAIAVDGDVEHAVQHTTAPPGNGAATAAATSTGPSSPLDDDDDSLLAASQHQQQRLHGWRLYGQQLRALLAKRALCARRDRLAVLTQLAVPLALVGLALWISSLQIREPSQPPLELSRATALFGRPLAWSAAPGVRNDTSEVCGGGGGGGGCLAAFLAGHPAGGGGGGGGGGDVDSGATTLFSGDPRVRNATLESYLLSRWYGSGGPVYDAIHMTALPPPAVLAAAAGATAATAAEAAAAAAAPPLSFVLLTNQSAVSALPAALTDAMTAVLSYMNSGLPPTPPTLSQLSSRPLQQQGPAASTTTTAAASSTDRGSFRRHRALRRLTNAVAEAHDDVRTSPDTLPAHSSPEQQHSGADVAADVVITDGGGAAAAAPSFSSVSWPMPTLPSEPVVRIQRDAASLMLVLCLVLASSVLSASFVVFLVREQDNNSKHLQLVSGAPPTAYWLANYCWDLLSYSVSAAGLLLLIVSYRLPQYAGQRLAATAGLLWGFGPAGLSLTYLLHYLFRDEMRALQRLNTAYFLTGYLGFLATWVADLICMLLPAPGRLAGWNRAAQAALRTASPHYCFARGMYDVQSTYESVFPFGPRHKPFDWDVFGSPMAHMAAQTLVYGTLAVLYDTGMLSAVHARIQDAVAAAVRRWRRRGCPDVGGDGGLSLVVAAAAPGGGGGGAAMYGNGVSNVEEGGVLYDNTDDEDEDPDEDEDVDVAAERRAVEAGHRSGCRVVLAGVRKAYRQGPLRPPLRAVRGLWLGVPRGECFGLLGVNGAGKTTTFRMLTGEVLPDAGDAVVGGHSVRRQLAAARRQMGYCPQFEALPGAMTGREVVAMYARLRGVPEPAVAPLARQLLRRLGLGAAADSACGGYSGGMRRKLGVAVALVGEPGVVALDEPSTGMDPGARRGLWGCLQSEVIQAGRTVILTSHSMEECEALCGRLTVMAAGRMRCLGTPQHLKGRFGGGYVLELKTLPRSPSSDSLAHTTAPSPAPRAATATAAATATTVATAGDAAAAGPAAVLGPGSAAAAAEAAAMTVWVASVCPGAELRQVDRHRYTFSIPRSSGCDLASLFEAVEAEMRAQGAQGARGQQEQSGGVPGEEQAAAAQQGQQQQQRDGSPPRRPAGLCGATLVDYCLSQTTLEHVFVAMAGEAAAAEAAQQQQQ